MEQLGLSTCFSDLACLRRRVTASTSHPQLIDDCFAMATNVVEAAAPHAVASQLLDNGRTIEITMTHRLEGEVATRSRLGISTQLGVFSHDGVPVVRMTVEEDEDCIRLRFPDKTVCSHPLPHAGEIWRKLQLVWAGEVTDRYKQRRVAWDWWQQHSDEYKYSKLWMHVESINGVFGSSMIPEDRVLALTCIECNLP